MKSKLLAMAILVAIPSTASAAKVNWEGAIQVTAVNLACGADIPIGDHYYSMYSPNGLEDNGANANLSLLRHRAATAYQVVGGGFAPNTNYSGLTIGGRGTRSTFTGKFITFTTTPAVTANTQTFALNARISNFQGTVGCTATIQGAYVRRRD